MKSIKNQQRGLSAKRNGDAFENVIRSKFSNDGWAVIKIASGCKWIGVNKIIAVKQPFDFMCTKNSKVIFFDAKSKAKGNFNFCDIDFRQVEWLDIIEKTDHVAGYIVYFKERNSVYFFSARYINSIKPGESLSFMKGTVIGGIEDMSLDVIFQK